MLAAKMRLKSLQQVSKTLKPTGLEEKPNILDPSQTKTISMIA